MENKADKLPLPELTEEEKQQFEKKWSEMTIANGYMFRLVMQNEKLCKQLLECILGTKVEKLEYREPEKVVEGSAAAKGIRLDLFIIDDKGIAYDIEMQTGRNNALQIVKRTRYYQSVLDNDAMNRGQSYEDLRRTLIIFICTFDPFGKKLSRYTLNNICEEDNSLHLNDGCTKIFMNTKGVRENISEELAQLLDYIGGAQPQNEFTRSLEQQVAINRTDNGKKDSYMRYEQEAMALRREGEAKGRKEGRAEGELIGMLRMACKLVKEGTYTVQKAATELSMSVEEFMQKAQAVAAL